MLLCIIRTYACACWVSHTSKNLQKLPCKSEAKPRISPVVAVERQPIRGMSSPRSCCVKLLKHSEVERIKQCGVPRGTRSTGSAGGEGRGESSMEGARETEQEVVAEDETHGRQP